MSQPSLDRAYFENVYARSDDPWEFATSPYEREKYAQTIAALGERAFGRTFEIGCSNGELTALLAARCGRVEAVDLNERALAAARRRNAGASNVDFALAAFPHDRPAGRFDLIVVSEVAYYWSDEDLARAIGWIADAARGGVVELVHFLPKVDDYVRSGDEVHAAFLADARFVRGEHRRAERYRIDVLDVRTDD